MHDLLTEKLVVGPDGSLRTKPVQDGLEEVTGEVRIERLWRELSPAEQRDVIDGQRLAYMDDMPVNWCPALGTVLANEEVIDGKSERGGHPVEKRPMRQWLLRITAYAERLLADLDALDWPESLKKMQREWIGRSVGAEIDFEIEQPLADAASQDENDDRTITVFTTRPATLYGATYMVLAPEHPLVDLITPPGQRAQVDAYRASAASRSDRDRMAEVKEKTGVFTGAYAINPINQERLPIWIADYVMMGYGTGAIMAVPMHDDRDFEFSVKFNLPRRTVVAPAGQTMHPSDKPFVGEGIAINSDIINGLPTPQAKERIIKHLDDLGVGSQSVNYKLRDWLFSRQRYWGEPFPIVLDTDGNAIAISESELPLELPPMDDFKPTGTTAPPLSKAKAWANVLVDGKPALRETNTMPQWAGSCWYYLRYLDPKNDTCLVDPAKERYWMPVDLYVGGAEHAVLHLLYARFWHKVLFDLGHVSTCEPFQRLINQGMILGETEFHTLESTPRKVSEADVERVGTGYRLKGNPAIQVEGQCFKMSKSRGNVINPDDVVKQYGADCFRLYVMYMGPLEAAKPWNTRDIVGMSRFLSGVWRTLVGEEPALSSSKGPAPRVGDGPIPEALDRMLHRTIKKVGADIEVLHFNTAIAELIKLQNEMSPLPQIPRELAEKFVLLLAPFAPHIAEEIWHRLGHDQSLCCHPWPAVDVAKLAEATMELPVQVNGKVRDKITVPSDAGEELILQAAQTAEKIRPWLAGKTVQKRLYVPNRLVNFVVR
jgi:leucyl-tRNA synthetase